MPSNIPCKFKKNGFSAVDNGIFFLYKRWNNLELLNSNICNNMTVTAEKKNHKLYEACKYSVVDFTSLFTFSL